MNFRHEVTERCVRFHFCFVERRDKMGDEISFMTVKIILGGVGYDRDVGEGLPLR